jgi:hypothetical protein
VWIASPAQLCCCSLSWFLFAVVAPPLTTVIWVSVLFHGGGFVSWRDDALLLEVSLDLATAPTVKEEKVW